MDTIVIVNRAMTRALAAMLLAALAACSSATPIQLPTWSSCPPGTKVSGEFGAGGGFGGGITLAGRYDCDGGPAVVPAP